MRAFTQSQNYTPMQAGKGYRLIGENAAVWADSIRTSIDSSEVALLCKALCTD